MPKEDKKKSKSGGEGDIFQCAKCGAVSSKKKKLCKPEKVKLKKVSEKDLRKSPCGK